MRRTTRRHSERKIMVDIEELAGMLSCGQASAKKIAEEAEARIYIGRRVLYSVEKVKQYLEKMSM